MKTKQNKLRGGAALSLALVIGMIASMFALGSVPAAADAQTQQLAQETIQGGAVLHCFDWSYNTIKENMADIAAAGYTAVQTSPVQRPKDYSSEWTDTSGQWWKLYQPLSLSIADGSTWLGTKAELKAMCDEADKYNIKVIVDIVSNHIANNGSDGGTYANLSSDVDSDLNNSAYYHTEANGVSDSSRMLVTMGHLGMPDLNTGNSNIQTMVLNMLKECVSLGVDGFRFDAAKHIETPQDDSSYASSYWSTVINGIKAEKSDVFIYGEILGLGGIPDITHYTKYMAVTDNVTGDKLLNYVYSGDIGGLADSRYLKGTEPAQSVIWAESHDTYMGDSGSSGNDSLKNTSDVSDDVITRTWAMVGSRADSTALFLARPGKTMGAAGTDTTWKSDVVTEVNKFKNYFNGTTEYLSYNSSANVSYNERGTAGVVIVTNGGSQKVSIPANKMADGTYKDQITNNTFTVSGGTISGTVGSSGVAVVYNVGDPIDTDTTTDTSTDTSTDSDEDDVQTSQYSLFGYFDGKDYGGQDDSATLGSYRFVNGWLEMTFEKESYVAMKVVSDETNESLNWYMTEGWQGDATTVVLKNTKVLSNADKLKIPKGTWYLHLTDNGDDTFTLSYTATEPTPAIKGRNVVLDDDINMSFISDIALNSASKAEMKLTWGDHTETVSLKNAETNSEFQYKAVCSVAAKEMTDSITAQLIIDGKVAATQTESVQNYLKTVISSEDTYSESAVTLAKAMLTYGAEAQKLFGYSVTTLANDGVTGYTPGDIDISGLASFGLSSNDFDDHGLTFTGASLRLESTTMMRLYFRKSDTAPAELPALTDGTNNYAAKYDGSTVYYDITGFEAGKLRDARTLSFTDSASGKKFTITVDGYTKAALASTDSSDDQLKATLKALYGYNTAAQNY